MIVSQQLNYDRNNIFDKMLEKLFYRGNLNGTPLPNVTIRITRSGLVFISPNRSTRVFLTALMIITAYWFVNYLLVSKYFGCIVGLIAKLIKLTIT